MYFWRYICTLEYQCADKNVYYSKASPLKPILGPRWMTQCSPLLRGEKNTAYMDFNAFHNVKSFWLKAGVVINILNLMDELLVFHLQSGAVRSFLSLIDQPPWTYIHNTYPQYSCFYLYCKTKCSTFHRVPCAQKYLSSSDVSALLSRISALC